MASPRIRSLKHTFFSDEKVCEFPLAVRWTFAGLIAHADDEGRLKGDPRLIKAQVWPLDDEITPARVADHLTRLASGTDPRIRWYRVAGRQYVEVINFKRHQYIQKPKPSELPGPDAADSDTIRVQYEYRLDGMGMDGNGMEGMPPPIAGAHPPKLLTKLLTAPSEPIDDPTPPFTPEPPPRVTLPAEAQKFVEEVYGLATETRRADVLRQLYDTIDPTKRGARLRAGVYVKARDADHLARVCLAVRMHLPQTPDTAIVAVLHKLQQPTTDANGRTVTEAASFDAKTQDAAARELEAQYETAAKDAARAWVKSNRADYDEIVKRVRAKFGDGWPAESWQRIAHDEALLSETRKAAGFPDFATWSVANARASPMAGVA